MYSHKLLFKFNTTSLLPVRFTFIEKLESWEVVLSVVRSAWKLSKVQEVYCFAIHFSLQ